VLEAITLPMVERILAMETQEETRESPVADAGTSEERSSPVRYERGSDERTEAMVTQGV
jgi:hypothetical protein